MILSVFYDLAWDSLAKCNNLKKSVFVVECVCECPGPFYICILIPSWHIQSTTPPLLPSPTSRNTLGFYTDDNSSFPLLLGKGLSEDGGDNSRGSQIARIPAGRPLSMSRSSSLVSSKGFSAGAADSSPDGHLGTRWTATLYAVRTLERSVAERNILTFLTRHYTWVR